MGGSVAGPMLALMNNLSYLTFFKKVEIDFEFDEKSILPSKTSMDFITQHPFSFSWFWYPPVTLGNHPFPFLSPIMIMIELTSPLILGVGRWLNQASRSTAFLQLCWYHPTSDTLGAVGEAGWQGTEGELEQEGRSQGTKCWIQLCLKTETTSVPCSYTDPEILPLA